MLPVDDWKEGTDHLQHSSGGDNTEGYHCSAFPPTLLREELPLPPRVTEEALSKSEVNRTLFISLSEPLLSQSEDRRRT